MPPRHSSGPRGARVLPPPPPPPVIPRRPSTGPVFSDTLFEFYGDGRFEPLERRVGSAYPFETPNGALRRNTYRYAILTALANSPQACTYFKKPKYADDGAMAGDGARFPILVALSRFLSAYWNRLRVVPEDRTHILPIIDDFWNGCLSGAAGGAAAPATDGFAVAAGTGGGPWQSWTTRFGALSGFGGAPPPGVIDHCQQDAGQFWLWLSQQAHRQLDEHGATVDPAAPDDWCRTQAQINFNACFQLRLVRRTFCTRCNNPAWHRDGDVCATRRLLLDIPQVSGPQPYKTSYTLHELLEDHMDRLETLPCPRNCAVPPGAPDAGNLHVKTSIQQAPSVLFIQINRMPWLADGSAVAVAPPLPGVAPAPPAALTPKLCQPVHIPEDLDLSRWLEHSEWGDHADGSGMTASQQDKAPRRLHYRLTSVSAHSGLDFNSGRWVTYVRDQDKYQVAIEDEEADRNPFGDVVGVRRSKRLRTSEYGTPSKRYPRKNEDRYTPSDDTWKLVADGRVLNADIHDVTDTVDVTSLLAPANPRGMVDRFAPTLLVYDKVDNEYRREPIPLMNVPAAGVNPNTDTPAGDATHDSIIESRPRLNQSTPPSTLAVPRVITFR